MLNELKKIWSEFHVKILVLLVILVAIGVAIAPIKFFSILEAPDSPNIFEGKAAIQIQKERYENSKGELSVDKINEIITYYKSIPDPEIAYLETIIKYPGVPFLLSNAYSPGYTNEPGNLNNIENGHDFYDRHTMKIKDILNDYSDYYQSWEKDVIVKRSTSLKRPYTIDFNRQWKDIYKSLNILFIVISLSAIVVGSKLFSYEKEKKMDMVLVTFGKKKMKMIGVNKVLALLTFLSTVFLTSVSIVSIIIFSVAGLDGFLSQIQIEFFTSIYQLTFGSAYLLFLFIGWIGIMAIGTLVSTINAFMQKSYVSLIVGFLVVILPAIMLRFDSLPISVRKFLNVQPINGFNMIENILSLHIFSFFGVQTLTTTAIILNALIIFIICLFIAPRFFISRIKDN